ncbi:MAG: hypothetical protein K2X35_16215 [Bryobacteraceae bacterium]|nr:hypothetical protein [Bryobacteraceae bacterium]
MRLLTIFALSLPLAAAEYKVEAAGPPPAEAPAEFAALLQKQGYRVGSDSPCCDIWLVATAPSGPASTEQALSIPTIPVGSFLGLLKFHAKSTDRRGQTLKPGWYTLRYGNFPMNGDHQGVSPQRDFLVLSPVEIDKTPARVADADAMYNLSRKASGTPHPAVLSFWKEDSAFQPGAMRKEGDHDWIVQMKLGDIPVSVLILGKIEE